MMGGVCVNTGTIPSKTLREAVLYLTGFAQRDMYGASYRVKSEITIGDLLARTKHVVGREVEVIRNQLLRNHVDILGGTARFDDEHTVSVDGEARGDHNTVTAENIVIATGTKPARPAGGRVRRRARPRLRRRAEDAARARVAGRGRRRGDRHRVRVDVRGARHPRHRRGEAARDAGLLRPRGRRVAQVPPARPGRHLPVRRGGRQGRGDTQGHRHEPRQRQADRRGHGDVLGGTAGRHRRARTWRRPGSPPTSAAGSPWTSSTAPRCRTSSPSAT